jgi:hypothetical protein
MKSPLSCFVLAVLLLAADAEALRSTRLVTRATCDVSLSHLQSMVRLICGSSAHTEVFDGSGTLVPVQSAGRAAAKGRAEVGADKVLPNIICMGAQHNHHEFTNIEVGPPW